MPIREFECVPCNTYTEFYHPSTDPARVPVPICCDCHEPMDRMISLAKVDTSDSFHAFEWVNPITKQTTTVSNLHQLRKIEHDSLATGHNIRFDAYSANQSNPDPVDGFGPEYWDGNHKSTTRPRKAFSTTPA